MCSEASGSVPFADVISSGADVVFLFYRVVRCSLARALLHIVRRVVSCRVVLCLEKEAEAVRHDTVVNCMA